MNKPMVLLLLFILVIYVTMVYGPIAAMLVEMFPTRIRYTSMSMPYHPAAGSTVCCQHRLRPGVSSGDICYGLWYPIVIAAPLCHRHAVCQGNQRLRYLPGRALINDMAYPYGYA